jgi:carbon-monoxide dehydrogenase medium subunit
LSPLAPFELHRPGSLAEASELLVSLGDQAVIYSGGTELLLVAKMGFTDFTALVDVKGIPELTSLSVNGELSIGGAVTHRQVERAESVLRGWPALAEMERHVGNVRVRNTGTIGGNLCFADPHSDPATFLLAVGGELALQRGDAAARRLGVDEFVRGPWMTALEPGELLVSVHVPRLGEGVRVAHRKISFRERPAATVAVRLDVSDGVIAAARVAVGSVNVRPVLLQSADELLRGAEVAAVDLAAVGRVAGAEAEPVADLNGSVEYKRQLVRVLTERTLAAALLQG